MEAPARTRRAEGGGTRGPARMEREVRPPRGTSSGGSGGGGSATGAEGPGPAPAAAASQGGQRPTTGTQAERPTSGGPTG